VSTILVGEELAHVSGRVASWRLPSGPVSHEAFKAAWLAEGLPSQFIPDTPSPETALRRAVSELRKPHLIVKSVQGSWVLTDERVWDPKKSVEHTSDVSYTPKSVVRLDLVGRIVVSPYDHDIFTAVNTAYQTGLGELAAADFTPLLSKQLVPYCGGVALRGGGGWPSTGSCAAGGWAGWYRWPPLPRSLG